MPTSMSDPFFAEDEEGDFDEPSAVISPRPVKNTRRSSTDTSSAIPPSHPPPSESQSVALSYSEYSMTPSSRNSESSYRRHRRPWKQRPSETVIEWEDERRVTHCFLCSSKFSVVKRKHHCRMCGRVLCSDCSSFHALHGRRKKQRVCSACAGQIVSRASYSHSRRASLASAVTSNDWTTPPSGDVQHTTAQKQPSTLDAARLREHEHRHSFQASEQSKVKAEPEANALFEEDEDGWFDEPDMDRSNGSKQSGKKAGKQEKGRVVKAEHKPVSLGNLDEELGGLYEAQRGGNLDRLYESDEEEVDEYSHEEPVAHSQSESMQRPMPSSSPDASYRSRDTESTQDGTSQQLVPSSSQDMSSGRKSSLRDSVIGMFKSKKKKQEADTSTERQETDTAPMQPKTSAPTDAMRTYYDMDVDDVVADDTPGYYDAMHRDSTPRPQSSPQEEARNCDGPSAVLPPTVAPRQLSPQDESYTMVDHPTEASAPSTSESSKEEKEGGFGGAVKRLLGFNKGKKTNSSRPTRGFRSGSMVSVRRGSSKEEERRCRDVIPASSEGQAEASSHSALISRDSLPSRKSMSESQVSSNYTLPRDSYAKAPNYQMTTNGADAWRRHISDTNLSNPRSHRSTQIDGHGRRDTFNDLFESPTNNLHPAIRDPQSAMASRPWANTSFSAVSATSRSQKSLDDGLDRFRQADTYRNEPSSLMAAQRNSQPSDRFNASFTSDATSRPLNDKRTWSDAQPMNTASYALPSGMEPRFGIRDMGDGHGAGNIMEEFGHTQSSRKTREDSIDDYFASFEKPHDYVFDAVSGGYVPADQPLRRPPSMGQTSVDRNSRHTPRKSRSPRHRIESRSYMEEERSIEDSAYTESSQVTEEDDGDRLIVDKISSMEGELKALKEMLSKRSAPRHSRRRKSQQRKASIFENDEEEEEEDEAEYRRLTVQRKKGGGKGGRKKRKDSFASLFDEDKSEDDGPELRGQNYESLFETLPEEEEGQSSDEEGYQSLRGRSKESIRQKSTKKVEEEEYPSVEEEEELPSLRKKTKETLGKVKSTSKVEEGSNGALDEMEEKHESPKEVKEEESEDTIDALFDDSQDDISALYDPEEDVSDQGDKEEDGVVASIEGDVDARDKSTGAERESEYGREGADEVKEKEDSDTLVEDESRQSESSVDMEALSPSTQDPEKPGAAMKILYRRSNDLLGDSDDEVDGPASTVDFDSLLADESDEEDVADRSGNAKQEHVPSETVASDNEKIKDEGSGEQGSRDEDAADQEAEAPTSSVEVDSSVVDETAPETKEKESAVEDPLVEEQEVEVMPHQGPSLLPDGNETEDDDDLDTFGLSNDVALDSLLMNTHDFDKDPSEAESNEELDHAEEPSVEFKMTTQEEHEPQPSATTMPESTSEESSPQAEESTTEESQLTPESPPDSTESSSATQTEKQDGEVEDSQPDGVHSSALVKAPSSTDADTGLSSDWQVLQEQERERKKRIQQKQRQAQREQLARRRATAAQSEEKSPKEKKKKKKSKDKDKEDGDGKDKDKKKKKHKKEKKEKRKSSKKTKSTEPDTTPDLELTEL